MTFFLFLNRAGSKRRNATILGGSGPSAAEFLESRCLLSAASIATAHSTPETFTTKSPHAKAPPGNFAGSWQCSYQGSQTPAGTLTLQQDGKSIQGTWVYDQGMTSFPIKGKVKGNDLVASFRMQSDGQQIKVTINVTLSDATHFSGTTETRSGKTFYTTGITGHV